MTSLERKAQTLLAIPDKFRETALAFPDKVDAALALIDDPVAATELLSKADAMAHYAKRVRADTEIANAINYGKTKIESKLGQILAAKTASERGAMGGRGNKATGPAPVAFDDHTILKYRKVGKLADRVSDYYGAVATNGEPEEKTTAGFLKWVADGIREERREEAKANLEDMSAREAKEIAGVYDVVVIDPPWPMEKIERNVAPTQVAFEYPTMTEEELSDLRIPCHDDCHVWLWTTHKFLPMALRLLEKWKLSYVCAFVWHKPGGFQPFGLPQYNCEFALYARRGTPIFLDTKDFPVCFNAPRGAHSEKPEAFYDVLRRVTGGRRIDMFNRRKIEGFDGWGLESK